MTEIRRYRTILQRSQREFAEQLGATIETYRTWDAGRRATPDDVLRKALSRLRQLNRAISSTIMTPATTAAGMILGRQYAAEDVRT